ncbi:Putative teichuronic acid biosynthesis glycosyltransferase TuaH [Patescibacteria group bacterium]|nr:Putative teichuronic acid biosynthesis glycosyltransferase TuaH [Patescibacteria group bacterium]
MKQANEKHMMTIICFSHLSWERSLFQRPQQLMLRLSKRFNILYVNSHSFYQFLKGLFRKGKASCKVNDNLTVYSPFALLTFQKRLSLSIHLNKMLLTFLVKRKIKKLKGGKLILWIYHPIYVNAIGKFNEALVVYDCMDDFTSLISDYEDRERNAEDERVLLKKADVVFAGGYSIADLKRDSRERIHVFPSAVEIDHFKKALSDNLEMPDDITDIPHPILGYWGAIDDRVDHELLKRLAIKHPEWSIVLLGPICRHKIGDTSYLNEIKNIFWLGAKDYSLLPNYAKAFDVCLIPFVLSREGKYLSPTKTLEYLATGKPVVSTPITDVVRFYDGVVKIADGPDEFGLAVKRCMEEDTESMKQKRISFTENKSWEDTAEKMEKLILDKIEEKSRDTIAI